MPLSEHEERILAELERQLEADDPRFALRARRILRRWGAGARLRAAAALGVVGVVLVASLTFDVVLGAIGMGLLLAALVLGGSAWSRRGPGGPNVPPDARG